MPHIPIYPNPEQLYIDGLSHWFCKSETHNEACLLSFDWINRIFITTLLSLDHV